MSSRNKRKKNPSAPLAILLVGAAVVLGGAAAWQLIQDQPKPKAKKKAKTYAETLPPPSAPPPIIPKKDSEEYGILFKDDCSDFIVVSPPEDLPAEEQIQAKILIDEISQALGFNLPVDPWKVASAVLEKISRGKCDFPPSPEASERIIHLYLWMVSIVGAIAMARGGKIAGVPGIDQLDETIGQQGATQGYPPFDPQVIPDLFPDQADEEPDDPLPSRTITTHPATKPAIQPITTNAQKSCPVGHTYDPKHDVCCPDGYFFDPDSRICKRLAVPVLHATPVES